MQSGGQRKNGERKNTVAKEKKGGYTVPVVKAENYCCEMRKKKESFRMENKYKYTIPACYTANITMAVVVNLSPLLFLTFRSLYGISYSMLGLLVLINFFTQLSIDMIFSFFSHRFNIPMVVRAMPVFGVVGLFLFAVWPSIFPNHVYLGLVIGTIIFSASSGLAEVLISPVIAAIPSDNAERAMSKLHSIYAWGAVGVVVFTTVYLQIFDARHWQWLPIIAMLVPLTSSILFMKSRIPPMETPEKVSGVLETMKNKTLWLCFFAIFVGGASECTMAQWCSSYVEQAVGMPKIWGDMFGAAIFSMTLGLGRSMYAKAGKNISKVLLLGSIGATACYFIAAISGVPVIGLIACGFTGICVSMLWPGNLIVASDRFPSGGVFLFALMAAGGDLGASVGPQLVGIVTDAVIKMPSALTLAQNLGLTIEQVGMKAGMLVGMLFPLAGIPVFIHIRKFYI